MTKSGGPLSGVRIVEIAGIGPGPLCCALLSDMGADIIRIDRIEPSGLGIDYANVKADVRRRGRRSATVNLKHQDGVQTVLRLIEVADAIIDPLRPGTLERLGLGPSDCLARNPRLVYGRITGWGQDGPLAHAAGHDINYIALSGVLEAIGPRSHPVPPLNVVGDMGGGAMFLALGVLAGILEAKSSGQGQVVDAAMAEGAAYLALGCFGLVSAGQWSERREDNYLDGGAHFWRCYETADNKFVAVGALEGKFYSLLVKGLELDESTLPPQFDSSRWPEMSERFAAVFRTKSREEWCSILEGTDACFAPVLSFREAASHPHAIARRSFEDVNGITQPAPAPKFSRTPSSIKCEPPVIGEQTRQGLLNWGLSDLEVSILARNGAIGVENL